MDLLIVLAFMALIAFILMIVASALIKIPSPIEDLISELNVATESNPMVPIQNLNKKAGTISRIIKYDNKYIQHQIKKGDKWVLHNLNGPAVYNLKTKESFFFIDGIQYDDELQYLVAKETYENIN